MREEVSVTPDSAGPSSAWTQTFSGVIVAALTPMRPDGSIDLRGIAPYVEYLIARGADALMVLGTTGEYITLTYEERCAVAGEFLAAVDGRVPVIVHIGHLDRRVARRLGETSVAAGAQALAAIVPYYHHVSAQAIELHLGELAREFAQSSFFVYNYPGAAGNRIEYEGFARLLSIPNVAGIKLSVGTWSEVAPFLECPPEVLVTCGNDTLMDQFVSAGGRAVVSGNAAAFPDALALSWAALHGSDAEAHRLATELVDDISRLSLQGSSDRLKALVAARGVSVGGSRVRTFVPADVGDDTGTLAGVEAKAARLAELLEGGVARGAGGVPRPG